MDNIVRCEHKYVAEGRNFRCKLCNNLITWGLTQEKGFLDKIITDKASLNTTPRQILSGYIKAVKGLGSVNFTARQDAELINYAQTLLNCLQE